MAQELVVHAIHRGGMQVAATVREHTLLMDYPLGNQTQTAGPTPLETLLASLGACAANTLILLLQRQKQQVTGLEVTLRAPRRGEHPTKLSEIHLYWRIRGEPLETAAIDKALEQAEKVVCPVWAMLAPGTPLHNHVECLPA